jgi:DNA primase
METLETAVSRYVAAMTVEAAQYLVDRGLTPETVRTFRVGVVTDPIPAHMGMTGHIAIPYLLKGQPLAVRSRNLGDFGPKYMGVEGEPTRVFNVDAIHEADSDLHVTEGEFDAMVLTQCGLPAVAFPGANNFKGHQARMLAGFNRVYVWGDPDQAGAEFTTRILNRLPRSGRAIQLRVGDVTETYLAGGVRAIYDLLKAA